HRIADTEGRVEIRGIEFAYSEETADRIVHGSSRHGLHSRRKTPRIENALDNVQQSLRHFGRAHPVAVLPVLVHAWRRSLDDAAEACEWQRKIPMRSCQLRLSRNSQCLFAQHRCGP